MRQVAILIMLLAAASATAAQTVSPPVPGFHTGAHVLAPCRGADLSARHVEDDAAMGGHNISTYALRNNAASPCTLKGYPRFELLNKAGKLMPRGQAVNSRQVPGDETPGPPELITLESGKEAVFIVYYHSGGAGYLGQPCPTAHKVGITAPETTRTFILNDQMISSCGKVQVSGIRKSTGVD